MSVRRRIREHKKKSTVGGLSALVVVVTIIQYWADIYPIICPLVSNPVVCVATGKVAKVMLDNAVLDGGVTLD